MRAVTRSTRALRGAGAALCLFALGGCASIGGGGLGVPDAARVAYLPEGAPLRSQTLDTNDMWARHLAMNDRADSLTALFDPESRNAPSDDLQRDLQEALALHAAGKYKASNDIFEAAEEEADARYTKSLSQMGLSLLTSDKAMDFTPSRAEMSMIPYYRMQNYLRLGDLDGALVEARKANRYFAELENENGDVCRSSTFLKYLTGLLYEAGGEMNDAVVSLRQAEAGYDACAETYGYGTPDAFGRDLHRMALRAGLPDVARAAAERYQPPSITDGTGEVVVLIENGFVAHRARQDVYFPILKGEVAGLDPKNPVALFATSARLTERLVTNLVEQGVWGYTEEPEIRLPNQFSLDDLYVMKLSWPMYRLEANAAPALRAVSGAARGTAVVVQDLSAEVVRDFEAEKKRVIARTLARGLAKYLAADAIEKTASNQNFLLGLAAGIGANLAANALETADTRSWSLLPDRLEMARLRLPAGEHKVTVEVLDANGQVARLDTVGTVKVGAGGVSVINHRVWGESLGSRDRLARAATGVGYSDVTEDGMETVGTDAADAPLPAVEVSDEQDAATGEVPAAERGGSEGDSEPDAGERRARGTLSVNVSHMAFESFSIAYDYTPRQHSIGVFVSQYALWEEATDITTVAVRFRAGGTRSPAGLSSALSLGYSGVCDNWCAYQGLTPEARLMAGTEVGYAVQLGPLWVNLGVGVQGLFLLEEFGVEGHGGTEPVIALPSGGLSIGWVF